MHIICADLEGVFVPEIWINVAQQTGIEELRLTTRDIADYDVLMKRRISILYENGLKLKDVIAVIESMDPLEGAVEFLDWLRCRTQVIILSDTFVQFAGPLMKKLGWPTLFCHTLSVDDEGFIADYNLRHENNKKAAVISLKQLNFEVIGLGDSYNDIDMLKASDMGILFHPPENVTKEFPEFPVSRSYNDLKRMIEDVLVFTY
ncbi:MAG: bifunctional phosphoserine phosphatase/homoserine phosphotransferase ThrH [Deltaproteobacteria bacterium]|nr:bifunctional phosphoserine phosphatase/homoserine phosphotransferase ThrH [Deltaproteobacteria bacterium]MBW1961968.1 bifunctional phosphoserine phosphatase/homoserine phosphotransferase ThrH [Deltaproteobacteria bacterium]MBW1993258.1 bifunctional phosphoserine phosphatase/homoserine phosphotransferase ThrH [Deltaproteobacteria bacterium]MBW2152961.1 bifunctional phosphoserine phosphatase/homoserine phosphotransferase ThrH [Deltaproteobacteria bacterium]